MDHQQPQLTPEQIVYEDNHLLAINKAAGWLTQGDETGDTDLVAMAKTFLKKKYDKPGNVFAGLVHRIDRPVSGMVIIAKTGKALSRMTRLFQQRKVQKEYLALTIGNPPAQKDRLEHYLWKDRQRNIVKVVDPKSASAKKAELHYEVLYTGDGMHLLQVMPVTGRPHQIRVQLSHIGCPIIGDLKYDAPAPLDDMSIALHAHKLTFIHPVQNEPLTLAAPLSENKVWDKVRNLIS